MRPIYIKGDPDRSAGQGAVDRGTERSAGVLLMTILVAVSLSFAS